MRNSDKDYLDQITEGDVAVVKKPSNDVKQSSNDAKKSPDKSKVKLETRRRLEDILEAKRLYAELDDYI